MRHLVFDLDFTLIDEDKQLYPGLFDLLHRLKREGNHLSIASFNGSARTILTMLKVSELFDIIIGYISFDKRKHLIAIKDFYGVDFDDMYFFDDDIFNIIDAKILGMNVIHIEGGLCEKDIKDVFKHE